MTYPSLPWPDAAAYVIRRAAVPKCLLRGLSAEPLEKREENLVLVDIAIRDGRIESVQPSATAAAVPGEVDLKGRMVWPCLVDIHTHLDKGEAIPRASPDGTIPGALRANLADYAYWTETDLLTRMRFGLRCAWVQGVAAIRTHLDYGGTTQGASWSAFRTLVEEWRNRIHLQAVGLARVDLYSAPEGEAFAQAIARHQGVLGGVTDGLSGAPEDQMRQIGPLLDRMFRVAQDHGLDVDLHVDQLPDVFLLPEVARSVLRTRFGGRVLVDHCISLALQPAEIVRETLDLCAEARLAFVSLPTSMLYLQDRAPGKTPHWRGVTLAHEIRARGLPFALATDNCRDPWFPYGDHDMVDIYRQSVRIFQLDHPYGDWPAAVGPVPAEIMCRDDVGCIAPGLAANLIIFSARNLNELLSRPQSDRLVLNQGRAITEPLPDYAELDPLTLRQAP